ncbi:MAG: LysR family transcriptional regulator [Phyllobacteriaceae bacterium]|jgi:DNA-binding transcriptional LysR family regulator|nr:LysR family transcriptional regulator [Phyllobacteriaceae bacterium]
MLRNIEDLTRFVAIGTHETLVAAGEACGATPMQMSRCLARLEEQLGVTLVIRTTRSSQLTSEGQMFLRQCSRILLEVSETEALMSRSNEPSGDLRVSVPATFGYLHVSPYLAEFMQRYPAINLIMDYSDVPVNIVQDSFDLAIRFADLPSSTLVARRIGTSRLVLACAPQYLEARPEPHQPNDLTKHDCLLLANPKAQDTFTLRDRDNHRHVVRVNARLSANTRQGLYETVMRGGGVGLFPLWQIRDDLAKGRLVRVLDDYETDEIGVYIVFPRTPVIPPRVRAFADFISGRLSSFFRN